VAAPSPGAAGDRVITVPNAISALRLIGVPVFLWLILVPHADGAAVILLMLAGVSDYLDGVIARRWNQVTRLGQILDPLADRLYILATLLGFGIRDIVPWWLLGLIVARDLVLLVGLAGLRRRGLPPPPVLYLGKAATLNLLYAFPLLLLGAGTGTLASVARTLGWAFALWGTGLYWWAGMLYLQQYRKVAAMAGVPGEAQ
jgi:cardiolipin synthase (CMP-forming)